MTNTMFMKKALIASLTSGLISGIFLSVSLKYIQFVTHTRVYTLLLNVDYIPLLNKYDFSEPVELLLHLIVSIGLGFFLYVGIGKLKLRKKKDIVLFCIITCFSIGAILYPTTAFSDRTPSLTSASSLTYWLTCHVLYGYIMSLILPIWLNNHNFSKD